VSGAREELGYGAPPLPPAVVEAAAAQFSRSLRASGRRRSGALDSVAASRRGQVWKLLYHTDRGLSRDRWAPSRRELAEALGCSASTIAHVVDAAERAGLVERLPRQSRALRTTKKGRAVLAERWSS